ncbi:MAG TPA: hypothetical protein P5049_03875, partial [Methanothrix sp.]|nr:hypothetical protein [Methanothrix sp.]
MTSSDLTLEHYRRPEVRETILQLCRYGGGLRALNGDDGWYFHRDGKVRLRGPEDYDDTISRARSIYITADVFAPEVFEKTEPWTEGRGGEGRPENPIGTRRDLLAYSLFADIDAVKDPSDAGGEDGNPRSKICHVGRKEAVEAAARYLIDRLEEARVYQAVRVAFSGQGIYVILHPGLSERLDPAEGEELDLDEMDRDYKVWLEAFNSFLADVEADFFADHPEHVGRVKIDKLNHQKRKLKSLLSIHRILPFAVVPLDPDDIEIDFDAARTPLTNEMLERARSWVETWECTHDERHTLAELLAPYAKKVDEEIRGRAATTGEIRRLPFVPPDEWCPFCQKILEYGDSTGKHRALGALAAWLYQAGWGENDAFDLWYPIASKADVETRIFFTSYGVINCPSCETIQRTSSGYPSLGFGGLGLCTPDEGCQGCRWPGEYGTAPAGAVEPTFTKEDFGYYETVKRKVKDEETGKTEKVVEDVYKFSPTKAIESILGKMNLCITGFTRQDKDIYRFDDEIYRADADSLIAVTLRRTCGDYAQTRQINEVTNGVLAELKRRPLTLTPDPFLMPLQNGVVDLRTRTIRPYRPEDLFTFKYNASYDPSGGDWRLALWQLCSTLPDPRDVLQAIDIATSAALRVPFDAWILLFGGGSNGKGNFEDMLAAFLGTERTSGMT